MVSGLTVKCKFCATKIYMRFQMGYFDIPFNIACPECTAQINGIRKIVDENSLILKNAEYIESNVEKSDYYINLSTEFPNKKITKFTSLDDMTTDASSPFINVVMLLGEGYSGMSNRIANFLGYRENCWNEIKPLYDLYFNNKIQYLSQPLLKYGNHLKVENRLDAAMALHQLTTIGFSKILGDNILSEFIKYADKINYRLDLKQLNELITFLRNMEEFDLKIKRVVKIYSRWMENFEKFIPIVMMSLGNVYENIDKEKMGITTTSLDEMLSLYADTYELILDFIPMVVGLNNIFERGDYNKFNDKTNIKDFNEYIGKANSKLKFINALIPDEEFSKYIDLNRNIRNAIAHFSYDFDENSQRITFFDRHKGKENIENIYLIDLALLCYDNMSILVYLNELFYSLRKIVFIKEGMKPHIESPMKK